MYQCEYTDTYGGQSNYCWVRRAEVQTKEGASSAARTRAIKKALGISGLRGRTYWTGDDFMEFRPYGLCTVAFAKYQY